MSILQIQSLSKRYVQAKDFAVYDFAFTIQKGEIVAITGESGCGKTTLLRLIAGLEVPDDGSIAIHHQIVADKRTWVKPEKRMVGMVFQDYALFPHLSVQDNIAFGLHKNADKKQRIKEVLDLTSLQGYEKRYPHELSGGQQQRVALARALAPQPSVLLLDEPFSNLDEVLKEQVREELHQIIRQSQITTLLVTHDTKDALTMADRIAVMKKGILLQCNTPRQLYENPQNEYVAMFFGKINLIEEAQAIKLLTTAKLATHISKVSSTVGNINKSLNKICIRPEHIVVHSAIENVVKEAETIKGIIQSVHFFGSYQELVIKVNESQLIARVTDQTEWQVGQEVRLTISKYVSF